MMRKEKVKKRKIKHHERANAPHMEQKSEQRVSQSNGTDRRIQAEINRAEARAYWERRRREQQLSSNEVSSSKPPVPKRERLRVDVPADSLGEQRGREMQQLLDDIPLSEQKKRKAAGKLRDQARKANSKRHRKRRKRSYTLYYIFVLFLILVTGITLSVTVFFNIRTIEVLGGDQYTAQQLSAYADVSEGDNLFRLNLKKMREAVLQQTTNLDDISIRRKLPETLSFELTPSVAQSVIPFSGKYYIISSGARVIQVSDSLEGYEQLVQISGVDLSDSQLGDFLDGNTEYQMAVELLQAVMSSRIGTVQGIFVGKDTEIKLNYQNRVAISLGSTLELTDKFALAGQVLAEDIGPAETGLLDVSQLGTAYFRPMTTDNMSEIMPPGGTWTDNSAKSSEN